MKRFLLLSTFFLVSLLGSSPLNAATAATYFDISLPSSREGGEPLVDIEIMSINFYGSCGVTDPPNLLFSVAIGEATSSTLNYQDGGLYSFCFAVVDTDGQVGVLSDPYQLTFNLIGRPGAGNINAITIECNIQRCRISRN